MNRLGRLLIPAGAAALVLAVGWWWLTYREVIGYGYLPASQAGYCLVGETDVCALARALCRGAHPLDIATYSSVGLWLGFIVLCVGLVLDGWKRADDDQDGGGQDIEIVPHGFWF
jgi:hypothetical protein